MNRTETKKKTNKISNNLNLTNNHVEILYII
jgi:hypothetical protein